MTVLEAACAAGHIDGAGPACAAPGELQGALRDLLERARYDLERGWPEAALDCIGRALRLLAEGAP